MTSNIRGLFSHKGTKERHKGFLVPLRLPFVPLCEILFEAIVRGFFGDDHVVNV